MIKALEVPEHPEEVCPPFWTASYMSRISRRLSYSVIHQKREDNVVRSTTFNYKGPIGLADPRKRKVNGAFLYGRSRQDLKLLRVGLIFQPLEMAPMLPRRPQTSLQKCLDILLH